jgi:hypothetical protein
MKIFLLLFIEQSLCELYIRTSRGSSNFENFYFTVNGKFSILFDTGSSATWIQSNTFRAGGMDLRKNRVRPCSRTYTYGSGYSVTANQCVFGELSFGDVKWNTEVAVPNGPVRWWIHHGIVGTSMSSEFVKKYPLFTIVPKFDHMGIYAQNINTPMHGYAEVTKQGIEYGKWIVDGRIEIGSAYAMIEFEIDTGYPALSLTPDLWQETLRVIRLNGGMPTGQITGGYGHIVNRCYPDTVPDVYYAIGQWRKRVHARYFTAFNRNNQCVVYVIVSKPDDSYIYLGSPFLRSSITQFDASKRRVGFRDTM